MRSAPLRRRPFAAPKLICLVAAAVILATAATSHAGQAGQAGQDIDELRAARGPLDPSIPKPESVLGFYPGADFHLANWPSILEYLQRLDAASDRMVLEQIGESAEGQPMVLAIISSPENLAQRERYRAIAERLARAKGVDETEARALAAEGKAIVWIDSGLHATEVAHGQHAPELAYFMVAGESAALQRIRDDVVFLLMPNMNPDGLNIVADWYASNLGTPHETAPLPVLYQKYAGHDNNRDWYMITQPETRAVSRQLYEVWYPQVVYNHHQTAPFPARIFVPPFADPANPNIPPLVLRGISRVGNAITTRLESEGKSGAVSQVGFTAWWNGGMRTAPYFHNMVGILTETALFRYATPNFYAPDSLPAAFRDGTSTRRPSGKYPMPWPGGWWRLRDPIEYMLSASLATLDVGSRYRDEWLMNIWRMGRDAIAVGDQGSPSAWVVAPDQHDPASAAALVNVLSRGGLEVYRASGDLEGDGTVYPAGSIVIPAGQAFRAYAVDMLEAQSYPDRRLYPGGPPNPPYDMAGWTLPFQMGVRVDRIEEPLNAELEPIDEPVEAIAGVRGEGSTFLLDPRSNATVKAVNRLLADGASVHWTDAPVAFGDDTVPAGAIVVNGEGDISSRMRQIAEEEGVLVRAGGRSPRGSGWRLHTPRVGLYEPWVANMDAGWTRYVLEEYGFEYAVIRDAEMRKGQLRQRYDAIILPSAGGRTLIEGHSDRNMPARFSGGLGASGVEALRGFVEGGGTLISLDAAGELPIERFGLPVHNSLDDLTRDEFFCPGSLLRIKVNNTHPLAFGMPTEATAFFVRSSAYAADDVPGASELDVVASYGDGELLESGWILGQEHLRGQAAVVEVPLGSGRVILLGFRVQFRAQPHETFKLLFNSLLYAAAVPGNLP